MNNRKNGFLILDEASTFGFRFQNLDHQRKKLLLILLKQTQNFCFSLHYNADNSYLFVNGKEVIKFKTDKKMLTFQLDFV